MIAIIVKTRLVLLSLAGAGLIAGCAMDRSARTGSILTAALKPGQTVPDFSFAGENGKVETFGSVRGVVTLVVFPTSPEWPECNRCQEIAQLAGKVATGTTPVTVVSVVTAGKGEKAIAALHGCRIKSFSQLIAVYDGDRRVQSLYGAQAPGKYFVIDSSGSAAAVGQLEDDVSMESALKSAVAAHEKQWQQMMCPPYDG